jgi:RimJ/RimL family protein N-acetyltransferase
MTTTNKPIIFKGKSKKGTDIVIRYPQMSDLKELWKYINKLSEEKTYIIYQGEKISLKEEKDWLEKSLVSIKKRQEVGLSIFAGSKVIGICGIRLGQRLQKHIGNLGVSIDKEYRGEGLGKLLMAETLKEAKKKLGGLKIVILGVFEENKTAQNLYLKLGFKEYGRLSKALAYKGKYTGEILMSKNL